jgi:hypothetical protein
MADRPPRAEGLAELWERGKARRFTYVRGSAPLFLLTRIFPRQSASAQQFAFGATKLPSSPPPRFRAGELSMSPVIAWVTAFSPSRHFPGPAALSCEWPPKFFPASAALISLRPDALWKARWRWLVLSTALHASLRGFLRSLRGRIRRLEWRRTFLRAHRAAHVRWFVSLA